MHKSFFLFCLVLSYFEKFENTDPVEMAGFILFRKTLCDASLYGIRNENSNCSFIVTEISE